MSGLDGVARWNTHTCAESLGSELCQASLVSLGSCVEGTTGANHVTGATIMTIVVGTTNCFICYHERFIFDLELLSGFPKLSR